MFKGNPRVENDEIFPTETLFKAQQRVWLS